MGDNIISCAQLEHKIVLSSCFKKFSDNFFKSKYSLTEVEQLNRLANGNKRTRDLQWALILFKCT